MQYSSNLFSLAEWVLDIDLVSDTQTMSYERMVKAGYKNVNLNRALHRYLNVQKRMVDCRTRRVHKSKEFRCPGLYELALENFEKKVKS